MARYEATVFLPRRNWVLLAAVVLVALGSMIWAHFDLNPVAVFGIVWGLPISLYVAALNPYPRKTRSQLVIEGGRALLNDAPLAGKGRIASAWVQPNTGILPMVHLRVQGGRNRSLVVADETSGNALLA